jgi:nucleotidyltransferase substrate binding protein (TIGR01987 family)
MNNKSIRWRQRFQNLQKAFIQLSEAVTLIENLSVLEKEGLVQRFEYTFELSWKTLKDYLESQDVQINFPREVIKSAFQYNILSDGEIWMEMLEKRNMMSHTYDEEIFNESIKRIVNDFFPQLEKLIVFFKKQN